MAGESHKNGDLPGSFQIDHESLATPRMRFTLSTKKDANHGTVHTQFRCDEFNSRRIEEILAARIDPTLRTKSDVLQDAVHLWLLEWDARNPDGANGIMRAQSAMRQMEMERQIRTDFLTEARNQLDTLTKDGDTERLQRLLQYLHSVEEDSRNIAPESYMKELTTLIQQTERLIASH